MVSSKRSGTSVKILSVLAVMVSLLAISAAPASADERDFWVENRAGGCLDFSEQYNFRVFRGCNGDRRYQMIFFDRDPNNPDVYRIVGKDSIFVPSYCLTAPGKNLVARGQRCLGGNDQNWYVRYDASNRPYFDSIRWPGWCLTKSDTRDSFDGHLLKVERCAGKLSQFWNWLN